MTYVVEIIYSNARLEMSRAKINRVWEWKKDFLFTLKIRKDNTTTSQPNKPKFNISFRIIIYVIHKQQRHHTDTTYKSTTNTQHHDR